jgi:hypothetical protein
MAHPVDRKHIMDLTILNDQPKYRPPRLLDPAQLGYLHLGAAVEPPAGRAPRPGSSHRKAALLSRLSSLARQLEALDTVVKATVYRAVVVPPPGGYARVKATRFARFDVVVLVETTSPEVIGEVEATEPCKLLLDALTGAATDLHVMRARNVKRIGDVDKTRDGLFLFNYFVADDAEVALRLWDHLSGWYVVETGLDNSTLLEPLGDADYVFVNHARWDYGVPRFVLHQAKPSFLTYVISNMLVNRTGAMPVLYRLAR